MDESKELKQKLLNMLKWFHAFCKEHGLRYYALGGTMLGAVRHKGFIPWDDDVDLGMPRGDYEKLIDLTRDLKGKYVLETPYTKEKNFFYSFSKLYDTETTLVENTKYKIKRGIYLDVFPLDGIGDSYEESRNNYKKITRLNNLLMLKVAGFRKGRKLYKNLGVALFRIIPLNPKKILYKLDKTCAALSFDDKAFVGNLTGAWGFREVVPYDVMGTPALYDFEDLQIYGAAKPDEYLTSLYGDWRKLPPIEKQVTHHDFIEINLNKSYLD